MGVANTFWYIGRLGEDKCTSGFIGTICLGCNCFWIRDVNMDTIYCIFCRQKREAYIESN